MTRREETGMNDNVIIFSAEHKHPRIERYARPFRFAPSPEGTTSLTQGATLGYPHERGQSATHTPNHGITSSGAHARVSLGPITPLQGLWMGLDDVYTGLHPCASDFALSGLMPVFRVRHVGRDT